MRGEGREGQRHAIEAPAHSIDDRENTRKDEIMPRRLSALGKCDDGREKENSDEPRSDSDVGSRPGGSRLRGKKLPSGMTCSSSLLWMGPGALPLTALSVRARVFSTFLSFFVGAGTVPGGGPLVEFRLETRPNSSESSMDGFCDFEGDVVARERENKLGMGERDGE
jgi:hypothetical protein